MWARQCTISAITALHVSSGDKLNNQQLIHAGIGPDILTFDLSTGHLLSKKEVLPTSVVHGIRRAVTYNNAIQEFNFILAFGQKTLSVIKYQSTPSHYQSSLLFSMSCSDMISDVKTLHSDRGSSQPTGSNEKKFKDAQFLLVIGYAHNNVETWTRDGKGTLHRIQRVESQVRCLLYSMKIFGNTLSELIVGSGTIFNDIVLWDPLGDGSAAQYVRGHHGVLFSVEFSKDGKYLCSTSDDRTVRCWKRSGRPYNKEDTLSCSYESKWVAFGHTGRVWDCVFLPSLGESCVASVAEDGTCRVWDNNGKSLAILKGHCLKSVWSCAIGLMGRVLITGGGDSAIKLWDIEKYTREKIQQQASNIVNNSNALTSRKQLPKEASRINSLISNKDGSIAYVATANGCIMACHVGAQTKPVNILYGPIETQNNMPLCTLSLSRNEQLLVTGDTSGRCHIIFGPEKKSRLPIVVWHAHDYRCWKTQWVNGRQPGEQIRDGENQEKDAGLLLTFGAEGTLKLWDVHECIDNLNGQSQPILCCLASVSQLREGKKNEDHHQQQHQQQGRKKKRTKTKKSFNITFSCGYFHDNLLFAGDNRGGLSLWSPNGNKPATLLWYKNDVHGHDQIHWFGQAPNTNLKGSNSNNCNDIYYSVGHDGRLIKYILEQRNNSAISSVSPSTITTTATTTVTTNATGTHRLRMIQMYKCGNITAVESVSWTSNMHMIVIGFLANSLIIYDITAQYELARVETGGWRRSYDLKLSSMPQYAHRGKITIIYVPTHASRVAMLQSTTKANKTDVVLQIDTIFSAISPSKQVMDDHSDDQLQLFDQTSLHTNYHGRLTTSVRWIPCSSSAAYRYMVTGGEDNAIKLLQYDCNDKTTICIDSSEVHTSAVRALCILPLQDESTSVTSTSLLFAAGGNNMLSWWTVNTDDTPSICKLQLIGSHKQKAIVLSNNEVQDDDCRYMSMVAILSEEQEHLEATMDKNDDHQCVEDTTSKVRRAAIVFCGSSQGTVSIFRCSFIGSDEIKHLHTFHLPGIGRKPLLSIALISYQGVHLAITGSTDGTIALWDVSWAIKGESSPLIMSPLSVLKFHNMGVNAIAASLMMEKEIKAEDKSGDLPSLIKFCIATGGDDNALSYGVVTYNVAAKEISVLSKSTVEQAAASAIKSVWTNGNLVVATGWDQRLSVWTSSLNSLKESTLTHKASTFVHVADCAALDLNQNNENASHSIDIIVVGQGLEINSLCI
jgi:WD40 repeat protein